MVEVLPAPHAGAAAVPPVTVMVILDALAVAAALITTVVPVADKITVLAGIPAPVIAMPLVKFATELTPDNVALLVVVVAVAVPENPPVSKNPK